MEAKVETKNVKQVNKEKVQSPWKVVWKRLRRNKLALAGLYILVFMILLAIIGPMLSPYKMEQFDLEYISMGPTLAHPLGTDDIGRDLLTRLIYGGRISLSVGLVAVIIEIFIGSLIGGVAGYYGGKVDGIVMRLTDIVMCFPFFPLLLMLAAVMADYGIHPKYRIYVVMFLLGIIGWTGIARIVRGQILSLREQEFMQAAEALGLRDRRKISRHLLPNTFASIIVYSTLSIGGAILSESALSFLGLGVSIPIPSWGSLIQAAQEYYVMQNEPWRWIPPGVAIFITVMAINLFGDGLRDALDPKLKR